MTGSGSVSAQDSNPEIHLEPADGPVGSRVTIVGSNAPPYATVAVLWVPWEAGNPCEPPPMGAFLVAEVEADAEGRFVATHRADVISTNLDVQFEGLTYFAKAHELQSDFVCFSYDKEFARAKLPVGLAMTGSGGARVDWEVRSRPTRFEVLLGL
jgi:hypothetical protein